MGDQGLPATERLRHRREFERVFQRGVKQVSPSFVWYCLPTPGPCSRLGMAVSKRVGNAVVRNRVKRYAREFFRRHKTQFDPPCDLVVVARRQAADLHYAESAQQLALLLRRYLRQQKRQRSDAPPAPAASSPASVRIAPESP